jgi:hypothetical protein
MIRTAALFTAFAIAFATQHALPAAAAGQTYTVVSAATTQVPSPGQCGKLTNPCKTLQEAFDVSAVGGVIDVLSPGDYGPLTITHAISIQGHRFASIIASSGANAITVNAGGGAVNLDGLLIDGVTVGAEGIMVTTALEVTIANCVVRNFVQNGIDAGAGTALTVVNTIVSDNSYNTANYSGIYIHSSGTATHATLTGVTATGNGSNGIVGQGSVVFVTIFSSNASENGANGILAQGGATVMVRDTVASNNYTGFEAQTSAQLTLAHSVASGNPNIGMYENSATFNTYKDNHVLGNTFDTSGTLTSVTAY